MSENHAQTQRKKIRPSTRSLPIALLRARESVLGWFRPMFSDFDLTEQQWRVIRVLYETEKLEISELARQTSILPPSMSGILKRLEARDLVVRTQDESDQRRAWISLGESALKMMDSIGPQYEHIMEELETLLGREQIDDLIAVLENIQNAVTQHTAAPTPSLEQDTNQSSPKI